MKALITIFIVLVAVFIFTQIMGVYKRSVRSDGSAGSPPAQHDSTPAAGENLPGLPSYLEASLAAAQSQGVEALGKWLDTWAKHVQDPRLAWIELDYVVLLNLKDHKAARQKFLETQARIPPGSPIYERIQKLAPAYER
jgi:hypothetical protein